MQIQGFSRRFKVFKEIVSEIRGFQGDGKPSPNPICIKRIVGGFTRDPHQPDQTRILIIHPNFRAYTTSISEV